MTIECPQCQEKCDLPVTSIPPEGVEIGCPLCGMTFRVRSHQLEDANPPPEKTAFPTAGPSHPGPEMPDTPDRTWGDDSPFPVHVFLQKDEIPLWMVDAFEDADKAVFPTTHPPQDPDQLFLAQQMRELTLDEPRDIPILIDDGVAGQESPEAFDFHSSLPPSGTKTSRSRKRGRQMNLRRLGIAVALCLLAASVFFLGWFIWKEVRGKIGEFAGKAVSALHSDAEEKKKLQFSGLRHEFVSRGKKERAWFVIEGKVTNNHAKACHSVQVKGVLFDERGKQAAEKTAYCGNVLKKEELQSYPPERIEKALQNVYGAGLSNFDLEPGRAIPFMLVFFEPPEKVSEFSVEIADFKSKGPDGKPAAP